MMPLGQKQQSHGESRGRRKSVELRAYDAAKERCTNKNNPKYPRYGGRGIRFRFSSFSEFLSCLGRRPSNKHSLDRKNVNGDYEPGNVRWATAKEQNNNRRDNLMITAQGKTQTATEWGRELGITNTTILSRYHRGFCTNCVLSKTHNRRCSHQEVLTV